jgi:hypothetical protein
MKTEISNRKKALVRQYHTVCSVCGLGAEEKDAILSGYGVESSNDLTESQLNEVINKLQKEPDQWRKRCMAAVGAWLRSINRTDGGEVVKAIAARAAGYEHFNAIPISRLRDVYYEFSRKAKTAKSSQEVQADIINLIALSN